VRRAIAIYETLVEGAPIDQRLLKTTAELLARCGEKDCLERAHHTWRRLEGLLPAGSDAWLEVRYEVCRCLALQEKPAEACRLLKVTRLLYPTLGGERLSVRFAELEKNCGAGSQ
jgi:hypothetical protein